MWSFVEYSSILSWKPWDGFQNTRILNCVLIQKQTFSQQKEKSTKGRALSPEEHLKKQKTLNPQQHKQKNRTSNLWTFLILFIKNSNFPNVLSKVEMIYVTEVDLMSVVECWGRMFLWISRSVSVSLGVPQGSIISPFRFAFILMEPFPATFVHNGQEFSWYWQ